MVYFEVWWTLGSHMHVTRCTQRRSEDAVGAFVACSVASHTVSGMHAVPSSVYEKVPPGRCGDAPSATVTHAAHTRSDESLPSTERP